MTKKGYPIFLLLLVMVIPLSVFANGDDLSTHDDSDQAIAKGMQTGENTEGDATIEKIRTAYGDKVESRDQDERIKVKTEANDRAVRILEESEKNAGDLPEETRVKVKRIIENRASRLKDVEELGQREGFMHFKEDLEFKARSLDKIKSERARENFLRAKERFENAKDKYLETRKRFEDAMRDKERCNEDCSKEKGILIERSKEHLRNSADAIIAHLNKVKERIDSNDKIEDEEANMLIATIEAKIKEIEEAKAELEKATTGREIAIASKKINAAWKRAKLKSEHIVERLNNARLGSLILKSKKMEARLESAVSKMAEKGVDTGDIESLINEFDGKIEEARGKFEQAHKLLEIESEDSKEKAAKLIGEAKDLLKEANALLREIIHAIKEKNGEDELEEAEAEG